MQSPSLSFSSREIRDLLLAWVALGVAFTIFFAGGGGGITRLANEGTGTLLVAFGVAMVTAGVGFLLHELAHKVVAVRYGQIAAFRADYGMLFLALMSAFLGFLFAAPGAVHHRGRLTKRQHGLIALAGPVTNLLLSALFVAIIFVGAAGGGGLVQFVGERGLAINLFLAAFNLIPFGALDGKTVVSWSKVVWVLTFIPSAALAFVVVFVLGVGF
jgi:Zn-dependent protease